MDGTLPVYSVLVVLVLVSVSVFVEREKDLLPPNSEIPNRHAAELAACPSFLSFLCVV